MSTRVLITGGGGYLASALTGRLLAAGHEVLLFDNGLTTARPEAPGAHWIDGDVREPREWRRALSGVGAVVHLAAVVGDPACSLAPDLAWEVNHIGTVRLVEECRRAGVGRFVFASTCSNYGDAGETVAHLGTPMLPQSVYAQSKIFAEHHLLVNRDHRFHPVILRFATLYGLAPAMRFDLAVNVMTADAVRTGRVTVHGGGQSRPFLHVRDAAQAVHRALTARPGPRLPEVYNCGAPDGNHTIMEVARLVAEHVPGARLDVRETSTDARNYRVDADPIREHLGFAPECTVATGIGEIARELATGAFADYTGPAHVRAGALARTLSGRAAVAPARAVSVSHTG